MGNGTRPKPQVLRPRRGRVRPHESRPQGAAVWCHSRGGGKHLKLYRGGLAGTPAVFPATVLVGGEGGLMRTVADAFLVTGSSDTSFMALSGRPPDWQTWRANCNNYSGYQPIQPYAWISGCSSARPSSWCAWLPVHQYCAGLVAGSATLSFLDHTKHTKMWSTYCHVLLPVLLHIYLLAVDQRQVYITALQLLYPMVQWMKDPG